MTPHRLLLATVLAGASCLISATAPAPAEPLAIIYRDIGYRGPARTLTGPSPDLDLEWPIRSIRVQRGVWELCARPNYRGLCTRYEASERSIPSAREYTQSARPVPETVTD
ncbi:beta/gamma crystallin-related protein [Brevundimonas sp.]|uniref:beta/gamma crystallin-related protein n=1 Tax=Brevundimonas sp. TaxID=1871086 RepID=UPI0035B4820B